MGKSHALHCEVQLLDDQSTTVDLDVSPLFGLETIRFCVECLMKCSRVCTKQTTFVFFLKKKKNRKKKKVNEYSESKSVRLKRN